MEDAIINPQQRLVRVKEGALISGVCNGVSIRYGLPLSLIRLIYIVFTCLTLFIGGIAIYFLLTNRLPLISLNLLLPGEEPESQLRGKDYIVHEAAGILREFLPIPKTPAGDKVIGILLYAIVLFLLITATIDFMMGFWLY